MEAVVISITLDASRMYVEVALRSPWDSRMVRIVFFGVRHFCASDLATQNIVEDIVLENLDAFRDKKADCRLSDWASGQLDSFLALSGSRSLPQSAMEFQPLFGANILVLCDSYEVFSNHLP